MTPSEIMHDLARDDIFPKAAMAAARTERETMAPVFIDLVDRLGAQPISAMKDHEVTALIPIFHLLGEWQDTRAYRPLLQMLRQPTDSLDFLLGDALTETSFRVVAGTFDGDLQPLFEFVDDPKADEFARSSMMDCLVLITQLHPERRTEIADYFRNFRRRFSEENSDLLLGWMDGIADLGLEDMADEIRAVFDAGLIPKDYCDASDILDDLKASAAAGGVPVNVRYQKSMILDAIEELSKWHCYSDAFFAEVKRQRARNVLHTPSLTESFMHETAPVGRNDPCPCGSGRKFKKCCLH